MSSEPGPAGAEAAVTVAAAARRLGVAPATLRTWARRYGLGPSAHEAGSHRRYTPEDLARLVVMRRLTLEGVPPVAAAAAALRGAGQDAGDAAGAEVVAGAEEDAEEDAEGNAEGDAEEGAQEDADGNGAPGLWSAALPADRTPLTRRPSPAGQSALQRAALAGDEPGTAAAVYDACRRLGPVAAWEGVVEPARRALGRRWEATGPGVDAVMLLQAATMSALRALPVPAPRTSAVALLAAAAEEGDPLPLHVLAAAAAAGGVRAWVLAPGLPREAVAAAVRRTGPAAVLLHAGTAVADAAAQLAPLPRLRPPVRLVLSGPGWAWSHVPEGRVARRAPALAEAAAELLGATAP